MEFGPCWLALVFIITGDNGQLIVVKFKRSFKWTSSWSSEVAKYTRDARNDIDSGTITNKDTIVVIIEVVKSDWVDDYQSREWSNYKEFNEVGKMSNALSIWFFICTTRFHSP